MQATFTTAPTEATGLRIFNTESLCVDTWNGREWIQNCGEQGEVITSNTPYALGEVAYRISGTATDPITGRLKFAGKNLGATISDIDPLLQIQAPAPTSDTDETIYGSMYQWGRYHDGHESRSSVRYLTNDDSSESSPVVTNSSDGQVPLSDAAYGKFIKNNSGASPYDWSQTRNDLLWGNNSYTNSYTKGIADPCPEGFRVPSHAELSGVIAGVGAGGNFSPALDTQTPASSGIFLGVNKWQWVDDSSTPPSNTPGFLIYPPKTGAYSNPLEDADYQTTPTLFLPAAGYRLNSGGWISYAGTFGNYWCSAAESAYAHHMGFTSGYVSPLGGVGRACGLSVRCVGGVITY
jgi:hypothetical protein